MTDHKTIAGVDVGGTYTDLIIFDESGRITLGKTPTTVENQAVGVMRSLTDSNVEISAIDTLVHGTTTTTNAVLERKLSKTEHAGSEILLSSAAAPDHNRTACTVSSSR